MLTPLMMDQAIDVALREDLGSGDVTSACCVAEQALATARAVARAPLVVCGGPVFARVFARVDPRIDVEARVEEGAAVERDAVLWQVRGPARSLLAAERVALNFAQRLSGIATLARRYVDGVPAGARTRIADTRKTTPGLRALERYAVRTGGAHNHRNDLGSAVLIKDNHIAAAGGVGEAVRRARAYGPHTSRIEVEVETLAELDEALAAGADIILLDNMSDELLRAAVAAVDRSDASPRPVLEASGGMPLERVAAVAAIGIDVISVGALTHSAPAADISLALVLGDGTAP